MIYERTEDTPLTPEQQRLYERLKANDGFAGNAAKLALFADLPYPFDPNIVYGLVERGLIKHNAIDTFSLTVCSK